MDIDLGDEYDKPIKFDISWLNKTEKYDIDLGDIEAVELLTAEETRGRDRDRIAATLKDFINK